MKQKLTKLLCSVFLVAFAIPAIAQSVRRQQHPHHYGKGDRQ